MVRTIADVLVESMRPKKQACDRSTQADKENPLALPEIVMLDWRVGELLNEARKYRGRDKDMAYVRYKAQLTKLVGWHAENRRLSASGTYDVSLRTLCNALGY